MKSLLLLLLINKNILVLLVFVQIEDDLTARINLGDAHWSVLDDTKMYYPHWNPPEG